MQAIFALLDSLLTISTELSNSNVDAFALFLDLLDVCLVLLELVCQHIVSLQDLLDVLEKLSVCQETFLTLVDNLKELEGDELFILIHNCL